MTALYQDPEADEWPMLALGVDGARDLFDEEMRYRSASRQIPASRSPRRRRHWTSPRVGA
jgi:hypothetical protein